MKLDTVEIWAYYFIFSQFSIDYFYKEVITPGVN